MTDLIARLEAATEGSRALDIEIKRLLWDMRHSPKRMPKDLQITIEKYTTSIDAALTLVPEGQKKFLLYAGPQSDAGETISWGCELGYWVYANGQQSLDPHVPTVFAPTPALAICIAALKARSAE